MKKQAGMTLVEVLTVVVIVGILFLIIQGPLMDLIRAQRVKSAANEVFLALLYARGEAIKRNSCVNVVPVNASNWTQGWSVQVPTMGGVPACGGVGTPTVVRTYAAVEQATVAGPSVAVGYNGAGRLLSLGDTSSSGLCNNTCTTSCTVNNTPPSFRVQLAGISALRCISVRSSGAPEVKRG